MTTTDTEPMSRSMSDTSRELGDSISDAVGRAQGTFSRAGKSLQRFGSRGKDMAGSAVETLSEVIGEHPIATICVGLGVGYALGRLMSRG